ncbi:hypothetical protein DDZ14_17295 [Maritimibacter sp. 55A14]|uniref:hypothetical protein n=1 Tax=Maritimibacter sp. 55A14 TaxID=2174844 RepID=UPI000D615C5F|nr:hypothetical protein [Maritimibacter sp. 55A14]PWE29411.1 hypothetical protein DDZ14_17295 [Maritimibacter sp. 55A14]
MAHIASTGLRGPNNSAFLLRAAALVALGIAVGGALSEAPDTTSGPEISRSAADPLAAEDWHGNVRRSQWGAAAR